MHTLRPRKVLGLLCLALTLTTLQVVKAITQGTKFANATVWGATILTDPKLAHLLGRQNKNHIEHARQRRKHAEETMRLLPFPVVAWSSVYAQDCPGDFKPNSRRGCAMAHYQIWVNWEYEGRLGSDKAIASDSDVLVVFEDDADITVKNITRSLEQELSPGNMKSDINLLGWCYEVEDKNILPSCAHAYAVTRAGVKKILAAYNICSPEPIDVDLRVMALNRVFSWQKARPESYSDRFEAFANFSINTETSDTRGIFVQKKGFASLNGMT